MTTALLTTDESQPQRSVVTSREGQSEAPAALRVLVLSTLSFTLFVLTAMRALWIHLTVMRTLHRASPDLSRHLDDDRSSHTKSTTGV